MNTLSKFYARAPEENTPDKVQVTVVHLGQQGYQANFPAVETFYQVKLQALDHFKIPPGTAAQYTLRYKGGVRPEAMKLARLGQNEMRLTLVAQQQGGRFGEALFLR